MRRHLLTLAFGMMAIGTSGCVALVVGAGAGAGTYGFVKGKTEVVLESPYNTVWKATGSALRAAGVTPTGQTRDALAGTYKGERADGANVVVDVSSLARNTTTLGIRVGAFGDRAFQERLADDIKGRL